MQNVLARNDLGTPQSWQNEAVHRMRHLSIDSLPGESDMPGVEGHVSPRYENLPWVQMPLFAGRGL